MERLQRLASAAASHGSSLAGAWQRASCAMAVLHASQPRRTPKHHLPPVVDNLPAVPEDKYEKLVNVLKKVYGAVGNISEGGSGRPLAL
jgi:hypothetical protein